MPTLVIDIADDADVLLVMRIATRLGGKCSLAPPSDCATADAQLTKLRESAESQSKEDLDQIVGVIEEAREEVRRRNLSQSDTDQ
ncbi:MAG: hypothetical protein H7330_13880 [Hymenobacteraceae bacterium]|nr:hypothetical protein [Hymenobacteraceae bacterium]